ncbi:glycoside hydrolase family 2 protein [Mycoplasmatota bacterium]|nr:glycoside hydrolase family 2 protein [Mycoplasmatota bacterium]
MKKTTGINFNWYVKAYDEKDLKETNLNLFKQVDIPNQPFELEVNNFNLKNIQQKYTYIYYLDEPKINKNQKVYLRFDGVAIESEIYVNQVKVGHHASGYTPYRVDITKQLKKEQQQEIKVIVSGIERKNVPPFGAIVDYLGYVGIYREVFVEVVDEHEIENVFLYSEKPLENDELSIEVKTNSKGGNIDIEIYKNNELVVNQSVSKDGDESLVKLEVTDKKLWSLEDPVLYDVLIKYSVNQTVYDEHKVRFGFRDIAFKSDGFYLNGKLRKISGLNRHQSYPYVGYAMPKQAQEDDVDILKDFLGVDMVRSSHYPCSTHFLNRCDERGLLVLEEIPGWQYIGDENFKNLTYESLERMIKRDRNHASICLWGVRINESQDDHDFYTKTNEIAHLLDPTRQTGGIRNLANSEFLEDVYTYNDFSHVGNNPGVSKKKEITKSSYPYLVSEYNGHMFPTKSFDQEGRRVDHAKRHLKVINDMREPHNGISGAIGWVMSDYHTHPSFGSGDVICYHGVLDMYRMPKYAAYSYRSQQDKEPVMEILSTMDIGDYPGGYLKEVNVFTNMDFIRLYKDDVYVNTFKPDKKQYPHLKHAPIVIKDFIGDTLKNQEKMTHKDAERTKAIFKAITIKGNKISFKHKLTLVYLSKKYHLSMIESIALYYKYMSGWGAKAPVYRYEGYKNDMIMMKKTITHDDEFICDVTSKKQTMIHGHTYDVIRFELKIVNGVNQIYRYSRDIIEINTKGPIELIGPAQQVVEGGQLAFWIKSKGKGKAKVIIKVRDQEIIKEVEVK